MSSSKTTPTTESSSDYPIVHIPIERLNYKRFAPTFQKKFEVNSEYMEWFPKMEKELPTLERPIPSGKWATATERLYQVYQSLKNSKKMYNPLIVMLDRGRIDFYWVIRGCQRLCCLRALGFTGEVPCRVAKITDSWNDNTQAWGAHPYTNVNTDIY